MPSFGEKLKMEREKRKITLDQISASTKIGTRMLQALEEDKFNQLPGGIFNKGFVRAYARFVGLDEDQTVADYLQASGDAPPVPTEIEAREDQVREHAEKVSRLEAISDSPCSPATLGPVRRASTRSRARTLPLEPSPAGARSDNRFSPLQPRPRRSYPQPSHQAEFRAAYHLEYQRKIEIRPLFRPLLVLRQLLCRRIARRPEDLRHPSPPKHPRTFPPPRPPHRRSLRSSSRPAKNPGSRSPVTVHVSRPSYWPPAANVQSKAGKKSSSRSETPAASTFDSTERRSTPGENPGRSRP